MNFSTAPGKEGAKGAKASLDHLLHLSHPPPLEIQKNRLIDQQDIHELLTRLKALESEATLEKAKRKLLAAGWRCHVGRGDVVWERLKGGSYLGFCYPEEMTLEMIKAVPKLGSLRREKRRRDDHGEREAR